MTDFTERAKKIARAMMEKEYGQRYDSRPITTQLRENDIVTGIKIGLEMAARIVYSAANSIDDSHDTTVAYLAMEMIELAIQQTEVK